MQILLDNMKPKYLKPPLGSWSFPMLLVIWILQNFQTFEHLTVKHTQSWNSGVYVSGPDTSEMVAFFCLGGISVAANSPTHDSDLDMEKQIFIWRQAVLHHLFIDNMSQQIGMWNICALRVDVHIDILESSWNCSYCLKLSVEVNTKERAPQHAHCRIRNFKHKLSWQNNLHRNWTWSRKHWMLCILITLDWQANFPQLAIEY